MFSWKCCSCLCGSISVCTARSTFATPCPRHKGRLREGSDGIEVTLKGATVVWSGFADPLVIFFLSRLVCFGWHGLCRSVLPRVQRRRQPFGAVSAKPGWDLRVQFVYRGKRKSQQAVGLANYSKQSFTARRNPSHEGRFDVTRCLDLFKEDGAVQTSKLRQCYAD